MSKPTSLLAVACATALALTTPAFADITSINLGNYSVTGIYALDLTAGPGGSVEGVEGSGITYARDRGSLFFVGDEGTGVIEISLTGQTLGGMAFSNWPAASSNHDAEGLSYLGGGVLVVGEERLQDLFRFTYVAGGSVNLATADYVSISNATVGNNGMEGISYDPRGAGSWVTVKQQAPEDILAGTLTFAPGGGASTMAQLFNPSLMGLSSLSDVQTLSPVDALAGTSAADNLLVLSLGSRRLIEVNRSGAVLSSFDLTNVLPSNGIEGVTVDQNGTIYLVAEQIQDGSNLPGDPNPKSQLIVLSVPEPGSALLLTAGLAGFLGIRRRRSTTTTNKLLKLQNKNQHMNSKLTISLFAFAAAAILHPSSARADLNGMRISEWMYNSTSLNGEFIEFTNFGSTTVNFANYSFADDSRTPGAVSLAAFGMVAPGESVILAEASAANFRLAWGLSASVKVIGSNTTNLGRADEINLFDGSDLVDRLTYNDQGASPINGPRTSGVSGRPSTAAAIGANLANQWVLSSIGDVENSYASIAASGIPVNQIGSPGTAVVPEPSSAVVLASGVAMLLGLRRRRA